MKILTIVGARPQFIKASAFSRALKDHNNSQEFSINETIIHTGQHFDENMSDIFFSELDIPKPKFNLNISNLSHGAMTGRMIEALEPIFIDQKPDYVLVYGDTNSTLAASLAASKLNIPLIHIESGLRSYNMNMPEEINRVLTDKVSEFLFCPSQQACSNLFKEGLTKNVHFVGDVMYDVVLHLKRLNFLDDSKEKKIMEKDYCVCTLHREENTNSPEKLKRILNALNVINKDIKVVFPIHPRTNKLLKQYRLFDGIKNLDVISPISYSQMLSLLDSSSFLLTDSGGMQKEAMYLKKPCLTLREETEWTETIEFGVNELCGSNTEKILEAFNNLSFSEENFKENPYGEGDSGKKIIDILSNF